MDGFLNVLKPPGMTSHDVVGHLRRLCGTKKVGHAGTLDPAAAGVLVVGVGTGTRLLEYLVGGDKAYRAEVRLGLTTDTQDAEGEVLAERDASGVTEEALRAALAKFVGHVQMKPPMYSAIRHEGRKLYEYARAGQEIELAPREADIHGIELLAFAPGSSAVALVDVECASGTYVRSLAAAIGDELGCGGMLQFLLRTRVGELRLESARTLQELQTAADEGRLEAEAITGVQAVAGLPSLTVDEPTARRLAGGLAQRWPERSAEGVVRIMTEAGELLCIADVAAGLSGCEIRPRKVFVGEVSA